MKLRQQSDGVVDGKFTGRDQRPITPQAAARRSAESQRSPPEAPDRQARQSPGRARVSGQQGDRSGDRAQAEQEGGTESSLGQQNVTDDNSAASIALSRELQQEYAQRKIRTAPPQSSKVAVPSRPFTMELQRPSPGGARPASPTRLGAGIAPEGAAPGLPGRQGHHSPFRPASACTPGPPETGSPDAQQHRKFLFQFSDNGLSEASLNTLYKTYAQVSQPLDLQLLESLQGVLQLLPGSANLPFTDSFHELLPGHTMYCRIAARKAFNWRWRLTGVVLRGNAKISVQQSLPGW